MEKRIQKLNEKELEKVSAGGDKAETALAIAGVATLGVVASLSIASLTGAAICIYKAYEKWSIAFVNALETAAKEQEQQ